MIGSGLFAKLSGDAAVTALVATRIYPEGGVPKDATYPLVTYMQVSAGAVRRLDGAATGFATLQQIDIYARTHAAAEAIAAAVRACLDGRPRETWGPLTVMASSFDEQFDGSFEERPDLHRIIQQYRIWS